MFFYLSKIFWFFIQPLNLAIFLLLAGLLAVTIGRRRLAAAGSVLAFLILALSAWTSLGAMMLNPLEERFARPPLPEKVDGIVVLGGGFEGAINLARGGYELNSSGDRMVETAILARRFPTAKVVVSGGTGALFLDGEGDAATAPRLLTALGVAADRMILENKSRNTYENAVFTKELVTPKPGETWLLVTSAFHMPRAKALFDKAGFATVPWPVDYRTSGREGVGLFRDNPADSLQATTMAIREWIGLFAYWLSGRIDQPFPGG
ncbi:YdcF family protein [Mesorhizobium sp. M7A.F.Ca.US.006.04.2.1]|uniref:YdcF family protein n=2 Tax=Mesorhizobium TaxID=68287 RepID=UPI000FCB69A5|nr:MULTISPECIES: YdcF family protein [unclassified Mesorhizobium]RUX74441.1 YdcF family protein [Mesorhizobium sp. M7A.F.Ca.US.005.03.1.1]RUY23438.1 YdcF family protein [Mesorhizobium sp. M7A.F.Ca.US.001.04.2.1]RUY39862.1 YdcF family protein [Mesorhizobium sp. M7A.F.Ca.US.001.04.1.1]RVA11879.1 YdcF family protein [Mesorhizobium sp. M7A.F.Ca.US.002.01.1.1]RVA87572.1 YdcF family protein [Mesorhizobium sp. M7A.F.Ca.US.006.04.2.1]